MRLALVQMRSSLGDKASNLAAAERMLAEVAGEADLACLPETFEVGYDLATLGGDLIDLAEPVPGPTSEALGELAARLGVAVVAGLVERDAAVPEVLYDSVVLLSRDGTLAGRYRKTHLYPEEHRSFRAGGELPVFELDGWKVGVAICFEHAFPEVFSTLARRGAQLVLNPAGIPVGFGYLQELRCRARAQDNQIYVATVNHVGWEGTARYGGASLVADPRGEVLARASTEESQVLVAELEPGRIRSERVQEPVFRARRPELYEP